ncbi:uncharacterized protein LOC115890601 [Sitophilus oryzae]|uniref:Telomerase reverse transcriptase n=1 Tax=Sitophilus oryzae TaxID=7048 RepID=A0A6J2YV67_SITOR|nr:uncharacterized protein LOC115890601 [Sitophilus oryzae]
MYYPLALTTWKQNIPGINKNTWKKKTFPENKLNDLLTEMYRNLDQNTSHIFRKNFKSHKSVELRCLYRIIPMEFFGSTVNRKKFFFVVKRILSQTKGECIHTKYLYNNYELDQIGWLFAKSKDKHCMLEELREINILVLDTIVKPFLRYFYYYLSDFKTRKLLFVCRNEMDSFIDTRITKYLKEGTLSKITINDNINVNGRLMFIPKKSSVLDHRPLIIQSGGTHCKQIQRKLKKLTKTYLIGCKGSFYKGWCKYLSDHKQKRNLYAVKLDIVNAFGSTDIGELIMIIKDNNTFTHAEKQFLAHNIHNQYVYARNTVYKWNCGLLQGWNLSALLSELYISYLCNKHLSKFLKPYCFMHRTVDDILFVTPYSDELGNFELAAMDAFLIHQTKSQRCYDGQGLIYCGKMFNMETREVSNYYNYDNNTEIRERMKIWNLKKEIDQDQIFDFVMNCMKFVNMNFLFSNFVLNTEFNSKDSVMKNLYDGMCVVAFRFDSVVSTLSYTFSSFQHRSKVIEHCVDTILNRYLIKIKWRLQKNSGKKQRSEITFKGIKFIMRRAFIAVFSRRNCVYKDILKKLKRAVKKSYINTVNFKYFLELPKNFKNVKMYRIKCARLMRDI